MTAVGTCAPGDELLRWVSEAGSGSWDRLRDASAYLCQKAQLNVRPSTLATQLSTLGHLDIDWSRRTWSVVPPTLNLVPGLGLCIVLTGSRPHYVDRRFEEATDDLDVYPFEVAQSPAPVARYAKCASVEVAESVARHLGASLVIDPARQLVDAMRAADETPLEQAPPPPLEEACRFDPETLTWRAEHHERPGLYRFDLHGRTVHRRLDQYGYWWAIDRASGQFLELRGPSLDILRWRSPSRKGGRSHCLEVRRELALPILAERAATVSSGLVPQEIDGWRRYLNVPRDLAVDLAQRLLQTIEVI